MVRWRQPCQRGRCLLAGVWEVRAQGAAALRCEHEGCRCRTAHRHRLPPEHDEVVGALHQKTREFVGKDGVHLVDLLYFDAHAN